MMAEIAVMKRESNKKNTSKISQKHRRTRIVRGDLALGTKIHTGDFSMSGSFKEGVRIKSSCVLQPVNTANSNTALQVDSRIPLHPLSINSYRLRAIAKLFQSYRFTDIAVKWVPRVNATVNGSVGIYYVDDLTSAATSFATFGSIKPITGMNLEATVVESEDGFICPVWEPTVCFYDKLHNEVNNFYRCQYSSGIVTDEIQGCLVLVEGTGLGVGNELGFFELSYTIEFVHASSPNIMSTNSVLGSTGLSIPWSTMAASVSYSADGSTTDVDTYNFWKYAQGIYIVTNSTYDYSSASGNWNYPAFCGQVYILVVKCFVTSTSGSNTRFTFYSGFGSLLSGDPIALTSGSIPTVDWTGFLAYQIGISDTPTTYTAYNLSALSDVQSRASEPQTVSPFSTLSSNSNNYPEQMNVGVPRYPNGIKHF
jgi:hypothetical protein